MEYTSFSSRYINYFYLFLKKQLIVLHLFWCTSHRAEELLAFVSLVVPLPAGLAVKFQALFILVARKASKRLLLHTTIGATNALIARTPVPALWVEFLCANTLRDSVFNFFVLHFCELKVELLQTLGIPVVSIASFDSNQDLWPAVLWLSFLRRKNHSNCTAAHFNHALIGNVCW